MADIHDKYTRHKNMAAIKSRNTKPELTVSKALYSSGYRFKRNMKALPGSPDIVLPKFKACIFVNGCFWHMHNDCSLFSIPKTRSTFWKKKLEENKARDIRNYNKLSARGWKVIVVWECSVKGRDKLAPTELVSRIKFLLNLETNETKPLEIR